MSNNELELNKIFLTHYSPKSLNLHYYSDEEQENFFKVWLETYLLVTSKNIDKKVNSEIDKHLPKFLAEKAVKDYKEYYDVHYKESEHDK